MLSDFVSSLLSRAVHGTPPVVHLFGGPFVSVGVRQIEVPEASKRLLAFVALNRGPVNRRQAAGTLWPDRADSRASANLRSALWRLNGVGISLMNAGKHTLATENNIVVDVEVVSEWATRLIGRRAIPDDLTAMPRGVNALEMLPGLYDDWALVERERMRQLLLHAFEAQSRELVVEGRYAEAVEVAMVVVCADPLRESAQRTLIETHLAEGNRVEARRAYEAYHSLLRREVGAEPGPALTGLVRPPRPIHLHQVRR